MKRFLKTLLPTLMLATMAAPLIDIGVASASVNGATIVGAQTPSPVALNSSASYQIDINTSGADWVEANVTNSITGVTWTSTCVQAPSTNPGDAIVTLTATTSGSATLGSNPITVTGLNFTVGANNCIGHSGGV